jgi:hypothetical protein
MTARSESWVAWARGPKGERVDGQGESAEQALNALTYALRKSGQEFKVKETPLEAERVLRGASASGLRGQRLPVVIVVGGE